MLSTLWTERARLAGDRRPVPGGTVVAAVNDAGYVIGEAHHRARLADADVELILDLRDAGLSYAQITAKFDDDRRVARSTVAAICTGARRSQTTFGHRRVSREPTFCPADPSEFDFVV